MIRVGIIGFAHGHVFRYGGEWNAHPEYGVQIAGGWDRDEARCKEGCEKLATVPFESLEALLASDISAVVISSETSFHAEYVELAAAAKKDIILYKPMALHMSEADRIVEAVNKNGVKFTMGWQSRTDPQNIKMREIVQNETLGKVCHYRRRHGLSTHTWADFENSWHSSPVYNRDIFADDSSHPIDMMHWVFGMPETVSCEMTTMANPKVVNDNGVALFKYENGMIAEITCSFTTVASEITTEIYCTGGSVQQYYGDATSTSMPRPEGQPGLKWMKVGDKEWTDSGIESPDAHAKRLDAQAVYFANYLKGEGPAVCTAEEGRDSLRLVLACYLSAREGRRVSVWDERIYGI
ncbi:MAG: Gfo/Idh/MocA family oxidoreductase [Ruminococcaceae bacterium]|nr:Gfo/Idh/MocA family oxidoreductase [Oscillospiraceae bacterium]